MITDCNPNHDFTAYDSIHGDPEPIPKQIVYQNFHNNHSSPLIRVTTWLYIAYKTCTIRVIVNKPHLDSKKILNQTNYYSNLNLKSE